MFMKHLLFEKQLRGFAGIINGKHSQLRKCKHMRFISTCEIKYNGIFFMFIYLLLMKGIPCYGIAIQLVNM